MVHVNGHNGPIRCVSELTTHLLGMLREASLQCEGCEVTDRTNERLLLLLLLMRSRRTTCDRVSKRFGTNEKTRANAEQQQRQPPPEVDCCFKLDYNVIELTAAPATIAVPIAHCVYVYGSIGPTHPHRHAHFLNSNARDDDDNNGH